MRFLLAFYSVWGNNEYAPLINLFTKENPR